MLSGFKASSVYFLSISPVTSLWAEPNQLHIGTLSFVSSIYFLIYQVVSFNWRPDQSLLLVPYDSQRILQTADVPSYNHLRLWRNSRYCTTRFNIKKPNLNKERPTYVTCFIISLFNAQHVSDVNTSILRSLRLICWVISWVVLLWFDVCWYYVVVWLWWCGIRMCLSASACIRIPHHPSQTTT